MVPETGYINEEFFERQAYRPSVENAAVQMTPAQIIYALEHDARFFIYFFIGDEIEHEIPDFHYETWDLMINTLAEQTAHALPRGHAKTTLAKLAAVWFFLFTPTRYTIYISDTSPVAAEACQDIIKYMTCQNFVAVFGEMPFSVQQTQKGFYKFELTLPHIRDQKGKPTVKRCTLRAFGAGQQIRGTNIDDVRPELAICDDVENDENTATKALVQKLRVWFYGAFLKAMSKKNRKVIFIGNMLSSSSLIYHFTTKSTQWYTQRYGCLLSSGEPLWPEIWPLEKIKEDFIEYQQINLVGRWFAEMMNIAMPDSSPLIKSDEIYYLPGVQPDELECAFITIDPAISKETWADETAVVVHGLCRGVWRTADYVVGKFAPNDLFFIVRELCSKWHTNVVGIEAATFQKALKYLFEVLMHMNQFYFNVIEVPHGNQRKTDRLAVFTSFIRKKIYALNEGDFAITEQLLQYDPTKKENRDDLIDACAMGPIMIENFMAEIMDAYNPDPTPMEISVQAEIMGA